ncbi:MAG: hypothetical protein QXF12_03485 [Candidatus Aenigmatarchaeota archaeon]
MFFHEIILEGLEKNDLNYLISDIVSIDQYEGKLSKNSIVVVFYIKDKRAARELEDFIQKFPSDILLMTEINDIQNEDNYFQLYVDFERKKQFVDEILELLDEIKELTNIKEWKMKIGRKKFIYRVNRENLLKFLKF